MELWFNAFGDFLKKILAASSNLLAETEVAKSKWRSMSDENVSVFWNLFPFLLYLRASV